MILWAIFCIALGASAERLVNGGGRGSYRVAWNWVAGPHAILRRRLWQWSTPPAWLRSNDYELEQGRLQGV